MLMLEIAFRGGNTVQLHITGLFQTAENQKWNKETVWIQRGPAEQLQVGIFPCLLYRLQ